MHPNQNTLEEPTIAGANRNYGKVPNYLNKFRNQREEEIKMRAIEDDLLKHPPGTRLMPEDERQETLRDLREAKGYTNV